jgi:hypothetical protein
MASQLRLHILLPVAILGILGLGVGAFAMGKSPATSTNAAAIAARIAQKQAAKNSDGTPATSKPKPAKPAAPKLSPLDVQLRAHRIVVVLFYAPGDDYDTLQTRETRAGAIDAHAGFLALNVTKNFQVAELAAKYDVRDSPATLIFRRGPQVAYRVSGYLDRAAVAQAAVNAGV